MRASGAIPTQPVIVGRMRERVFLHEEIARALNGRGRLALIGGEAGIGKTTLTHDAICEARQHNALVLTGHCQDLTASPPYAPWLDLIAEYRPGAALPEAPASFAGGQLAAVRSQAALFADLLGFITHLATTRPIVMVLEDLHWSDSASLELLRYLAARITQLPVLLLVTYRVDELTRLNPLYRQLPGLVRAGGSGLRIDLKRLDEAAMLELIRLDHALPADDEARLAIYLERHARGNPFYATELLRGLEDAGVLIDTGETSHLFGLDQLVLPPLLTQVIETRLSRLDEGMRQPLALAAVIGEEVPLDLWSELAGLDDEAMIAIVEQGAEAHIVQASHDGTRAQFAHALIRDTLYESISPPRRRLWHRAVAEALMRRVHPDPDAIAHHLSQSGDPRAPEWLILAGNRAQRAYTWLIAAERFIAAAHALTERPDSERQRGWLLFRAARLMRLGRPERGLEPLRESRSLALAASDDLLSGDALYSMGLLLIYNDLIGEGIDLVEAGIAILETVDAEQFRNDADVAIALADALPQHEAAADNDVESSLLLQQTTGINHRKGSLPWWYAASGRIDEALDFGPIFIEAVEALPNPGGLVQAALGHAYHGLGYAHAGAGDPERAREAFATAREIYRRLDHHGVIALAYTAELRTVGLVYDVDNLPRRRQLCEEAIAAVSQAGGAMPPGFSPLIPIVGSLVIEGCWDEILAIAAEVPEPGNSFLRRELAAAVAEIAVRRGDFTTALDQIQSFLPDGPVQRPGSRIFVDALYFQRLAAEIALAQNDPDLARVWLDAHDRWLAGSEAVPGRAEGKLAWAGLAAANGDLAAAESLATQTIDIAQEPAQPLVLLRAHRLRGECATRRGAFPDAEPDLCRAIAIAQRCEAMYDHALSLIALAELRKRENELDASQRCAAEAIAICRMLGAEPALSRIAAIDALEPCGAAGALPFGLTSRECEVLALVATGLTDAAVAAELFISPRTVGHHLRSIYSKLDVSSRSAATRIAIEQGIAR
jgi:DNA-binding CsgD family transcriptional regulator